MFWQFTFFIAFTAAFIASLMYWITRNSAGLSKAYALLLIASIIVMLIATAVGLNLQR